VCEKFAELGENRSTEFSTFVTGIITVIIIIVTSVIIVFGPKRDEVTGEWIKLHNEELNDVYSLPIIVRVVKSRRMRWAGHVARMGEDRGVHRVLVGKPE
jgi:hypothetical protein